MVHGAQFSVGEGYRQTVKMPTTRINTTPLYGVWHLGFMVSTCYSPLHAPLKAWSLTNQPTNQLTN